MGPAFTSTIYLRQPKAKCLTSKGESFSNRRAVKHKPRIKGQIVAPSATLAAAPGLPLITLMTLWARQTSWEKASLAPLISVCAPPARVTCGPISSKAGDQHRRVRHVTTVTLLHERRRGGGDVSSKQSGNACIGWIIYSSGENGTLALMYRCGAGMRKHSQSEEHLDMEDMHNTCMEILFIVWKVRTCSSKLLFRASMT